VFTARLFLHTDKTRGTVTSPINISTSVTYLPLGLQLEGARGDVVVEALRYKPEGRTIPDGVNGFFSLT
jgi:hypothetical protein